MKWHNVKPQVDEIEFPDIIYDAWETNDRRRRVTLAKKALKVSPLCADAYVLLARETGRNLDEAIDFYARGMEAGGRRWARPPSAKPSDISGEYS